VILMVVGLSYALYIFRDYFCSISLKPGQCCTKRKRKSDYIPLLTIQGG
jgi:hypothetical protein